MLNVYFRDLQYLVAIGLQLWFYATPIIYPMSRVPGTKTYGGQTSVIAGHVVHTGGVTIPIRAIYSLSTRWSASWSASGPSSTTAAGRR